MKCTNKCLALLTALAVCFGATGCRDEAIAFSYNPDYKVSAFRISGDTGFETANAFASGLCVVNGDINTDNSAVDIEAFIKELVLIMEYLLQQYTAQLQKWVV